jgi:hypothetical protein
MLLLLGRDDVAMRLRREKGKAIVKQETLKNMWIFRKGSIKKESQQNKL